MKKTLLMLAGLMLVLATAVSADWPAPPCLPNCLDSITSAR
jgi:hypothetical protein